MVLQTAAGSNDKNTFTTALFSALSDFYTKDPNGTLGKLYQALAEQLAQADVEVSALLHDNFISVTASDEMRVRGEGTSDRLAFDGAFQVDRISLIPQGTIVSEIHVINSTATTVTLNSIPEDYEQVTMVPLGGGNPVSIVTAFDEANNTVTVAGVQYPGQYTFRYVDKGVVKRESERLIIPTELFEIGWGQGGFGNFGFGY